MSDGGRHRPPAFVLLAQRRNVKNTRQREDVHQSAEGAREPEIGENKKFKKLKSSFIFLQTLPDYGANLR